MKDFYERLLCIIVWLCEQIEQPHCCCRLSKVVFSRVSFNGLTIEGEIDSMELREGQSVVVTATLKTSAGHDAAYEKGTAVWTSSDDALATVTVSPDNELVATVVGVDGSVNGSAVITLNVDGDPDADETKPIIGTIACVITQGEATVVELTAGTPTDVTP